MEKSRTVFLISGKDTECSEAVRLFVKSLRLDCPLFSDLQVKCREELGTPPSIIQIIKTAMKTAQGIIALFTPDEFSKLDSRLGSEEGYISRPNVIFETGMAWQGFNKRLILLQVGIVRPFSDLTGIHKIEINELKSTDVQNRKRIVTNLKLCGCVIPDYVLSNYDYLKSPLIRSTIESRSSRNSKVVTI
jgi:predicted nucleotide-binding protein